MEGGGSGSEESRNESGLGIAIDLISSEYGLSPKEVIKFDLDQFSRLLEIIGARKKRALAVDARIFQAAIASVLSGEAGSNMFENLMSELLDIEAPALSDRELGDLGIGKI